MIERVSHLREAGKNFLLSAFLRCDSVKSCWTLLNVVAVAMRTDNILLVEFGQGQDLRERLVASEAKVFVCRHIRLARKV
jgi:hypothetical protein